MKFLSLIHSRGYLKVNISKGGDSLSYLPKNTVKKEAVNSISSVFSSDSFSLIKKKGFIINRFI